MGVSKQKTLPDIENRELGNKRLYFISYIFEKLSHHITVHGFIHCGRRKQNVTNYYLYKDQ